MPKSFGNKSFITPPTAVKLLGDAGDLADLQEATAHMTVMNRMTSGLQQATRRVVLSSGATATLRRAFGHETITLDRSSIFTPEEACIPYMESGRQRWETGTIDISGDLLGICNGPCPGRPLNDGDPSAALAVAGAVAIRQAAPASGFTGKLHLLVQAVYGSKRKDIASVGNGEIMLAGVLLGHSWEQSTVLYTDESGEYWLLQLGGMETATIQKWVPNKCGLAFDAATIDSEAYRLAMLMPSGGEVAIDCGGIESDIGVPCANGWHATKNGDVGHIVLNQPYVSSQTLYNKTRLCSFLINDSGAIWDLVQEWEAYIADRFSVNFEVVTESDLFLLHSRHKVWVPEYYWLRMQRDFVSTSSVEAIVEIDNAPLYCRYKNDDSLEIVAYSISVPAPQNNIDNHIDACSTYSCACDYQYDNDGFIGGFVVGALSPVESSGTERKACLLHEINITGSGEWNSNSHNEIGACSSADQQTIADFYTTCSGAVEFFVKSGNTVQTFGNIVTQHFIDQLLIVPFYNHESFIVDVLENNRSERHGSIQTDEHPFVFIEKMRCYNNPDNEVDAGFVHYIDLSPTPEGSITETGDRGLLWTRKCYWFPRNHSSSVTMEDISGECGTFESSISCGETCGDVGSIPECMDDDNGWIADMQDFYNPTSETDYTAPMISVLESYQHGHRLAWFTGDKSVEAHDGYDSFVDDGCFVGAS